MIRNENGNWTPEALACSKDAKDILKPLYNEYKNWLSDEEIYYIVSNEMMEIIIFERFDEAAKKVEEANKTCL